MDFTTLDQISFDRLELENTFDESNDYEIENHLKQSNNNNNKQQQVSENGERVPRYNKCTLFCRVSESQRRIAYEVIKFFLN